MSVKMEIIKLITSRNEAVLLDQLNCTGTTVQTVDMFK